MTKEEIPNVVDPNVLVLHCVRLEDKDLLLSSQLKPRWVSVDILSQAEFICLQKLIKQIVSVCRGLVVAGMDVCMHV